MALSFIPSHSSRSANAQLLLLPYCAPNNLNLVIRGEQGCGSTGDQVVCFTQQILLVQPTCKVNFSIFAAEASTTCKVKIRGNSFSGL